MILTILKSKIHRASVTEADSDYVGSVTIDEDLLDAAGIIEYERVLVADVSNGERLETYAIAGERGSGVIGANGAAAKKISVGDIILIMAFAQVSESEAGSLKPKIVFVNEKNKVIN